jgi:hypothetical protein
MYLATDGGVNVSEFLTIPYHMVASTIIKVLEITT